MPDVFPLIRELPAEPITVPSAPRRTRRIAARAQKWLAIIALLTVCVCAVLAPVLTPFDPVAISLADTFQPPSATHWMGTDPLGRDILSRVMAGASVSLSVALIVVSLAGVIGTTLGVVAGYLGGAADAVIMRLTDMQLAFPAVILALVLAGVIGVDMTNLVIVLTLANWARFARVTRGEVLSLKTREFVLLARLAGAGTGWILRRHIVPNLFGTLIVLATLDLGSVIVLEATLSFLGLGVQPPLASWGSMIAEGRSHLSNAWWICVLPGLVLIITVLAANQLGDVLREKLNPVIPETW
ncbi:ABC transporter permease [Cupriavidus pampae]|uniref:D,D-dipeptide transport system permease protein DdpC n=1 Tax=Cupriavidus pampae TaxID=659251 RepID=A0ABN7Y2S2_9BURK|nr:ABC transporter permease [Cupriavidus pampae]CAG9166597.1 putative D,D-dipeptide transport system permease protein DdpC [Cupriavidus pampae]